MGQGVSLGVASHQAPDEFDTWAVDFNPNWRPSRLSSSPQQLVKQLRGCHVSKLEDDGRMLVRGYLVLLATLVWFVLGMYWLILSKWMPETSWPWLDWIKHDDYYGLLMPSLLIATWLAFYLNWLGLKFFRHN